jgi:hypothetical protein
MVLNAKEVTPSLRLLSKQGQKRISVALDGAGHGSLRLIDADSAAPGAAKEIEDKGAHMKFDHGAGASSYVSLNNAGESGLVLIDQSGHRRLSVLLPSTGDAIIQRFNALGEPVP